MGRGSVRAGELRVRDNQAFMGWYAAEGRNIRSRGTCFFVLHPSERVGASMIDDLCEVTITAPEPEWLAAIVHELIELRLCASAHIVAPIRSIYRWHGVVEDTQEARAFLRARRSQLDAIVRFVRERHPYEVANITAVPIVGGNPAYLEWVLEATHDE